FAPRPLFGEAEGGFVMRLAWGDRRIGEPVRWDAPPEGGGPDLARAEINNLHFMEYLEGAGDAAFARLVRDWIAGNPPRAKGASRHAWRPYNLSLRVFVWLGELARRPGLDPAFRALAGASIAAQLDHLAGHLETDLRGNHLVKNVKALLWGAAAFEGPAGERWRRLGLRRLDAEIKEQILADGCHYERSPAYHCQVLADFVECRAVLEPGPLRDRLDAAVRRMLPAMRLLTHPDGLVAPLNDGGLRMAHPPAAILDAWRALAGEAPPPPPSGPFALADAGYYGLATPDERVVVDCGPLEPAYLAGHAHGDLLAVEWSTGGRRVLVDQGTFQYVAGPGRAATRATASHNTVTLDGRDQSDFHGAFRVGRRARPLSPLFEVKGSGFRFMGSHDGYDVLPGAPRHHREVEASPGRLLVRDRIAGGRGQKAEARYLLHPDCALEADGDGFLIENGPVTIRAMADRPLRVEPASWFPDLYVALPTRRLVAAFDGHLTVRFERLA
ncbi:MAG: alginate lyase family protein, partial [Geminicoccaceae bacterium]|nr:alginate lyase family protein [Geminicoccaceae bacterium]